MDRNSYLNQLVPFSNPSGHSQPLATLNRGIYNNRPKDLKLIRNMLKEKVHLHGSSIMYYAIDTTNITTNAQGAFDLDTMGEGDFDFLYPKMIYALWNPVEYKIDLSKFGVIMPEGSDLQVYLHVDDIQEIIGRKPITGDILETEYDHLRYQVSDVFYGQANLWDNIFCMLTLSIVNSTDMTSKISQFNPLDDTVYVNMAGVLGLDNSLPSETKTATPKTATTIAAPKKTIAQKQQDIETMLGLDSGSVTSTPSVGVTPTPIPVSGTGTSTPTPSTGGTNTTTSTAGTTTINTGTGSVTLDPIASAALNIMTMRL